MRGPKRGARLYLLTSPCISGGNPAIKSALPSAVIRASMYDLLSAKLLGRVALCLSAAGAMLPAGFAAPCERVHELPQAEFVLTESTNPPDFDGAAHVDLPDDLGQRIAPTTGMAWYRIALPRSVPGIPCGLYLDQVSSSAVVFLNGRWLGSKGSIYGGGGNTWNYPVYLSFPSDLLGEEQNWVAVGMRGQGVLADSIGRPLLGPDTALRPRFERALLLRVGVPEGCAIVMGLLCVLFAVLALNSRDATYGWFSLSVGLCTVTSLNRFWSEPPLDQRLVRMLVSLSGMWLCCSTGMLVLRLLEVRARVWMRAIGVWALIVLCAAWLARDLTWAARVTVWLNTGSLLIPLAGFVALGADRTVLARTERRILTATGIVALLLAFFNLGVEALKTAGIVHLEQIPYLGLIVSVGFGSALFRRLLRSHQRATQINLELRAEVAEKHAELELQFAQTRDLERRQAIGIERERLVREMHDGVGGSLVALLALADRGTVGLAEVSTGLREALDDMRLVIHSLDPGAESIPAVLAAMRARIEPKLRSQGLRFRWAIQDIPDLPRLGPAELLQVLRIVQEAIANALKHAGAQSISIATGCSGGPLRAFVAVVDDGKGMPPHPPRGRGLENMQKRARALGGEIEVHSGPGGTTVKLWIPVGRWS
jgi:signal transduction histidine kinase